MEVLGSYRGLALYHWTQTSNHLTWALTWCGSGDKSAQNGVNLWCLFDSPKVRQSEGLLYRLWSGHHFLYRLGSGLGLGPVLVLVESSDYRTFGLSIENPTCEDGCAHPTMIRTSKHLLDVGWDLRSHVEVKVRRSRRGSSPRSTSSSQGEECWTTWTNSYVPVHSPRPRTRRHNGQIQQCLIITSNQGC